MAGPLGLRGKRRPREHSHSLGLLGDEAPGSDGLLPRVGAPTGLPSPKGRTGFQDACKPPPACAFVLRGGAWVASGLSPQTARIRRCLGPRSELDIVDDNTCHPESPEFPLERNPISRPSQACVIPVLTTRGSSSSAALLWGGGGGGGGALSLLKDPSPQGCLSPSLPSGVFQALSTKDKEFLHLNINEVRPSQTSRSGTQAGLGPRSALHKRLPNACWHARRVNV